LSDLVIQLTTRAYSTGRKYWRERETDRRNSLRNERQAVGPAGDDTDDIDLAIKNLPDDAAVAFQ